MFSTELLKIKSLNETINAVVSTKGIYGSSLPPFTQCRNQLPNPFFQAVKNH